MFRALVDRDTQFDGLFFAAVTSTGIFCRPTCPARKPKPENVTYFASAKEAMYHGFRPCARCHPLERNSPTPSLVARLCRMIEEDPLRKIGEADLRQLGIDPSTARRQFQRHYGMTFHAYHRARRMGGALKAVRNHGSVVDAQLDHGYQSASGFWQAFTAVFGQPPAKADQLNCLFARWLETPLGAMLAIAGDRGLYLLEFVDRRGLQREIEVLRRRHRTAVVPGDNCHLERVNEALQGYFSGDQITFDLPIVMTGSEFECGVWRELQRIAPGEAISYAELAQRIDNPGAVRAVGRANGKNCIALAIPCHRVIGADGSLTGYAGGLWRKQWLLEHEGVEGFGKIS